MDKTKDTPDHVLTDNVPESGVATGTMMIGAQNDSVAGSENISSKMTLSVPEYSQPDPAIKSSGPDAGSISHTVSGPTSDKPPTVISHAIHASPGIASDGSASGVPKAKAQTTKTSPASSQNSGSVRSMSAEELGKLIESYCDPARWASSESRKDWKKKYETEEDGFADNAFGDEDPNDIGDGIPRKFLYHRETLGVLKLLSDAIPEDPEDPPPEKLVEKVQQWMPKGLVLRPRQLLAAIHPDRFQQAEAKEKAHVAFIAVKEELERNPSSENFKGFNQSDDAPMDFLEEYHEKAHIDATPHISRLYEAFQEGQIMAQDSPHLSETVKAAYREIDLINEVIEDQNTKIRNEPEFGMIYLEQIINCWKLHKESDDPSMLWKLCEARHYPLGWAHEPPVEDFSYDLDRGHYWVPIRDQITTILRDCWEKSFQNLSTDGIFNEIVPQILKAKMDYESQMISFNQSHKRPDRLNIVNIADIIAHYCGLKVFSKQMMAEQFTNLKAHLDRYLTSNDLPQTWSPSLTMPSLTMPSQTMPSPTMPSANTTSALQVKQLGNGKAVIKSMPRTVDCTVKLGYTTSGEKIIAMQKIGAYSARFVTESDDGSRRIVDSGQAGAKLAMEGALKAGVPFTTTSHGDIAEIKVALDRRECWSLTYVAVSQWDTTRVNANGQTKLPYTIVGLSIKGSEFHLSRSVLTFLIGASSAEKNIVRCMGGDEDNSLCETLKSKLQLEDFPHLLHSGAPRSLSSQQSFMIQQSPVSQDVSKLRQDVDSLLGLKSEMEKLTAAVCQLVQRMHI